VRTLGLFTTAQSMNKEELMNKKYCFFQVFALTSLVWFCSGCVAPKEMVPTQTRNVQQAVPLSTATLPPQNTPTPVFPFHTDLSCWQMKPLQAGNDIKGSLVFQYSRAGYFYWDVSSFHGEFLANETNYGLPLPPPDGTYMPIESNNHKVMLMFPNYPSITLDFPMGEDYYDLTYLLNGKILATPGVSLISDPIDNKNYQKGIGYTVVYHIYDPKTGSLTSHSVLLPNFKFFLHGGVFMAYIAYSPDGKYVLYRSELPHQEGKSGFSLLDLQSNQIKWTVPEEANKVTGIGESQAFMPVWKPDAGSLTYIWNSDNKSKDQNYYNISLDGAITQFTRFEDILPHGYILYSQPQWSPDMRYLALQVQEADHPREPELFIWDDVNKTLLNPCLPVSGINPIYSYGWSFDSKHIALGLYSLPTPSPVGDTYSSRNIIFDIPNKVIYGLPNAKDMRDYLKLSDNEFSYSAHIWLNWEIP
jgi:hypothetical protein